MKEINKKETERARKICKKYGTSYYVSTFFLPHNLRVATWILYAFVRIPDEIVDTEKISNDNKKLKIEEFKKSWTEIFYDLDRTLHLSDLNTEILSAAKKVFIKYEIPFEYSNDFLDAMLQDTEKSIYNDFDELAKYMYGSASVIGFMMSHILGFDKNKNKETLYYANKLGVAMQMTNFLRDIREDFIDKKRIYMPQDDLKRFDITLNNFEKEIFDNKFKDFMKFQIKRNRDLYIEANLGINLLNKRNNLGVWIASKLYEKILDKIEEIDYNVFMGRVRTTKYEKIKIILNIIWKRIIKKL